MPRGDRYWVVATALADGAYLDLRAGFGGADTEAVVTILDHGGAIELYLYDGTVSTLAVPSTAYPGSGIDPTPAPLAVVKEGQGYRMRNVSGGVAHLRGSGVVTK